MARAGSVASIDFSKRDRVQAGPTSVTVVSRGGTSASGDPRSRSVLAISQPDDVGANDPERQRFQSFDSSRCTCVFLVARDIDRAERCRCQCQCQCVDSVYLVCARGGWVDGSCGLGGCMRFDRDRWRRLYCRYLRSLFCSDDDEKTTHTHTTTTTT